MPEILRQPVRMNCSGVDLVHPLDRMPEAYFPYLNNVRVVQEGRIEGRPGYTLYTPAPLATKALHSIRRLNDPTLVYAPGGYIYVVGNGTELWAGPETLLTLTDSGYSGNPLSMLNFRPENSPASWMYLYDQNKMVKIRPDKTLRSIGLGPPTLAPVAEYGTPAITQISDDSTFGYTAYGGATASAAADRTNGTAPTISAILYNAGTTGWCCIAPNLTQPYWAGDRMRVRLNTGGGNDERVFVREIHPAIAATTVAAIQYDSGATGACSVVLTSYPKDLARNSLIVIGGETVRVLSVSFSPDGSTYSIRCVTTGTRAAGNVVTGLVSWYTYTAQTHAAGEAIALQYVLVTVPAAASSTNPASVAKISALNLGVATLAGTALTRPVSMADDYLHISLFLQTPANVASVIIRLDVDANTTTVGAGGNAFTRNYYQWTIQVNPDSTPNSWMEYNIPLSQGIRFGGDVSRTLANVAAIQMQVVTTGACNYGFDCWYVFGTYGPTIAESSPVGILYQSSYRDSNTGTASVVSPPTRYEMFPLREAVLVTPATSAAAGVDKLDIYRLGGILTTATYVGTVVNNVGSPNVFTDNQPDSSIAGNPVADPTLLQPWPLLDLPWTGTVDVIGTSVIWRSGTQFKFSLVQGTVITIGGVAYQTFGQPRTATFLEITNSGGTQTNVPFTVASPLLAGQPLPIAFGPLEGPFSPVAFAVGDTNNPGTLYYTNAGNLDAASDQNTLEITAPSEPLIGGGVWYGIVFVGSRDNLFIVRYSYLSTVGAAAGAISYQFNRVPAKSGIWARWACCSTPVGFAYLGRDGIYVVTEQGAENITDASLYPLFPHDGQPATGANGLLPVDMTALSALRMSYSDQAIYFDYNDTNGARQTLRFEIPKKRWFPHTYGDAIMYHYLAEESISAPVNSTLLLLSKTLGYIYTSGGNTDNGTPVTSVAQVPSLDGGDERAQKLFVDVMTDADGTGQIAAQFSFNNQVTAGPLLFVNPAGSRIQSQSKISAVAAGLQLYRNISCRYTWTGGPGGPRLYAIEPSGYVQPYLSTRITTQIINLGFQGWKHHRRLYAGIISVADVVFTISTQDGRAYGPYVIPSTGGVFKIVYMMLDQNIKDTAFGYQLDGGTTTFALFPDAFTVEVKEWTQPQYIDLAVFKA